MDIKKQILKMDKDDMLSKLLNFSQQCREAYALKPEIKISGGFDKILFCGMGGSAIGGDILKTVCSNASKIPVFVSRDYSLPSWTDKKTLIIAASYSGNTEETLSSFKNGLNSESKVLCISSNGKLEALAASEKIPFIKIPAGYPPRCAFGYLFFPVYKVLSNLGAVQPLSPAIFSKMDKWIEAFSPDSQDNAAVRIAGKIYNKIPILYCANSYLPAALRWKTQIAENSKSFVFVNALPEMNHNEIMAWRYPSWFIKKTVPVFIESAKEHARIKLREQITKEIISQVQPDILTIKVRESSLISALLYLAVLGDWVSFYLALQNGVNPTEISEINLLKNQLGGK